MSDVSYYEQSYPPSVYAPPPSPPTLTSLVPATSVVGVEVTVLVNGTGFLPSSVVEADGTALPTDYVSATQLSVTGTPLVDGVAVITVRNGTLVSNSLDFTVTLVSTTRSRRRKDADEDE